MEKIEKFYLSFSFQHFIWCFYIWRRICNSTCTYEEKFVNEYGWIDENENK